MFTQLSPSSWGRQEGALLTSPAPAREKFSQTHSCSESGQRRETRFGFRRAAPPEPRFLPLLPLGFSPNFGAMGHPRKSPLGALPHTQKGLVGPKSLIP